jgi:hypothetical protein
MAIFNFGKKEKLYAVTKEEIYDISHMKAQIKAMDEGQKLDILTSLVTQTGTFGTGAENYTNNYPTYTKQVQVINYMYNNRLTYGNELLRTGLDTRVSFIAGEGLNIKAEGKTLEFIEKLLNYNKMLEGSRLLAVVLLSEMEGKNLLRLVPEKDNVKINYFSYWTTPYTIENNPEDLEDYKKAIVTLDKKNLDNSITLKPNEFVYVKLGGSPDRVNETPPKVANVLTDIENYSRTKYDMRHNNHLFGKVTPVFLVEDKNEAKALQNKINSMNSVIGKSYAGTAKQVFYLEPSGAAQKVLHDEMIDLLRIITTNLGIPIHLINHPELMSNRSTAESMLEMINSATIKERLIWEEALTDLVRKAMVMATERGIEGAVNDPEGFELRLSLVSYANLKQIQETWLPLAEAEYISKKTIMSLIPGINPSQEERILKKEKEERIDNMPTVLKEGMDNQEQDKEDEDEQSADKE